MRFPSLLLALLLLVPFPSFVTAQTLNLPDPLPGTAPLKLSVPLDEHMVAGIDAYALRRMPKANGGQQSVEQALMAVPRKKPS